MARITLRSEEVKIPRGHWPRLGYSEMISMAGTYLKKGNPQWRNYVTCAVVNFLIKFHWTTKGMSPLMLAVKFVLNLKAIRNWIMFSFFSWGGLVQAHHAQWPRPREANADFSTHRWRWLSLSGWGIDPLGIRRSDQRVR